MSIQDVQRDSVIPNEAGIVARKTMRYCTPSPFAVQHLFYVLLGIEYICDSSYQVRRKELQSLALFYLAYGEMRLEYLGKTYTARAGDVCFLDLRHPHSYRALTDIRIQQYLIAGSSSQAYFDLLYGLYGPLIPGKGNTAFLFFCLQGEIARPLPDDHRVSWLLHEILGTMAAQSAPEHSRPVAMALEYMSAHFRETCSLDELSGRVSLSKYHLLRRFKQETGRTPHEYLTALRLRRAKELLTETQLSVEEVGYQCGFASSTAFIRSFRQATAITPASFRKYFDPAGFRR